MPDPAPPRATARSTRAVLLGGITSGLGAYGFTILGARVLGDVDYAPVGVLWTVQYLVLTVGFLSLEAWVTREGVVPGAARRWIGGLTVGMALLGWLAAGPLLGSASPVWPLTAGAIPLAFGTFAVLRGLSAARGEFTTYGLLTGGESMARLAIAAVVLLLSPTGTSLAATLPAGAALACLAWPLLRRGHRAAPTTPIPQVPVEAPPEATGRYLAATTTANAMVQVLLAGGPLLTAAIGAPPGATSRVFVTTTAARAPLVLMYSGLLARLLAATKGQPDAVLHRWTRRGSLVLVGAAVLAAGAGWVLGPPLVALAFGAPLRPSGAFAALTGASVVLAVGLLAANQVLIALRAAGLLVAPWVAGLAAGLVVAATADLPPDLLAGWATLTGLSLAGVLLVPRLLARTRDGGA